MQVGSDTLNFEIVDDAIMFVMNGILYQKCLKNNNGFRPANLEELGFHLFP